MWDIKLHQASVHQIDYLPLTKMQTSQFIRQKVMEFEKLLSQNTAVNPIENHPKKDEKEGAITTPEASQKDLDHHQTT